jgi:hypothetical protein
VELVVLVAMNPGKVSRGNGLKPSQHLGICEYFFTDTHKKSIWH